MNERAIFDAALAIADLNQRQAFLDEVCADDVDLRARVEALLQSHESAGSFLEVPIVGSPTRDASKGQEQTAEISKSNAVLEDDDESEADEISLSFLGPATKPGSIGRLGHYEIISILGQGAFGIVFKAFDEKLHRQVAIKVMNPELAATSPPRKRFLREARAAAAVRHENVVQVYSVEEQPLPYLVMEYIDGQTLQQKIDDAGPLDTNEVLHLSKQIASGLAAAHAQGLIHRDIKPGNILLEKGAEQKLKITDFGLARAADDATMTRTGTIAGTPMYMAPEQAQGQTLDHRADLFSFGSVLYQMASGRPPFRESTTFAVLRRVVEDTPRPLQEIIPEIPDWLVAIVAKLHAKQPDDRFQTAKEVADLLARCQSEWMLNGKVTEVSGLVSPASGRTTANRGVARPDQPVVKAGQRRWLVGGGVALLVLLGSLAILLNQNGNQTKIEVPGDSKVEITKSEIENQKSKIENGTGWHGWPADAPAAAIAPFDAAQAQEHQRAWAEYLKLPVEYTNSLGMKFVLIPPGEFMMGSTAAEIEAALKDAGDGMDTTEHPVETVSWNDAADFCAKLSQKEKLNPFYFRAGETITPL